MPAARQRAFGHAGHDVRRLFRVEPGGGEIIQEEERTRALYQDVVNAVVDDVVADAAIPTGLCGQFDLRANPIGRGHQHGMVHLLQDAASNRPPNEPMPASTAGP